jgi:23S rRNA (adenine2503-C2)-methyltransferase
MNCSFCFTGTQGLKRNLKAEEIIMQYLIAYKYALEKSTVPLPTPNIVFMGQGEPFHNFDEVKKAIQIFQEKKGLHLGPRQLTISSAGYLPGIKRMSELQNINLAISFHSAKNEIRNELIPLNKKYPIEELISTLENITLMKRQYITFEYLLIDELNNSEEDAKLLAEQLKSLPAIVNIIPFNPFPGSKYKRPNSQQVENFKNSLVAHKVRTMIRTTKGDEILAACGQLNTKSPL